MHIIAQTSEFIIREFLPEEASPFVKLFTDERLTMYLPKRNAAEVEQLFKDILNEYNDGTGLNRWAAIGPDNEPIGFIMLKAQPADPAKAELGYVINYDYHNRGIATWVCEAIIQYGFDVKHLDEIFAVTVDENVASQRVLIKAGLKRNGILSRKGMELALFTISR